ncbi:MAG TPA: hypothetical protein VFY14_05630 [Streptomyces sp.]|nr:hypothetical protein [Streptomyces sp.]
MRIEDDGPAHLKVTEWRRPVTRALFTCDGEGMSRVQLKPGIQAPGFEFTALLSWSGFDELDADELAFAEWAPDGAPAGVVAAARKQMRMHFRSRVDKGLRQLAHQHDRMPGCALSQPRFRIRVRTWGEIIEDCQERLCFYGEQLEYQSSTEHAMDYLIREHNDAVSELLSDGTLPAARSGNVRVNKDPVTL